MPQQQQLQASSMADQIPTFEQLSTRRPSIVSLQNTTESLETGQTARGPSPVSAALGNHMPARHPADHETNDNEEEDRTQEFDTQSVPLQGHGACGQEATPPPSFQESQNALTRNNRTLSSPPMPSSPIRTQVQRSSSVASHLSTSSPRSSSASSAVFLSVANSALARLSADVRGISFDIPTDLIKTWQTGSPRIRWSAKPSFVFRQPPSSLTGTSTFVKFSVTIISRLYWLRFASNSWTTHSHTILPHG